MDSSFILNIFPTGSLSISVVTTVWLGIWVVAFFNLRFGWVLSGLVVPGYLVPLILVKPWSAGLVVAEAALTYFLVWVYSEKFSRLFGYTNFFGRDRFFALLLASVLVRVGCDVFLLPAIGEYINTTFNLNFDYRNNLQSFGLIVIALVANQFWKPGLRKGLFILTVTVFLTYLLVRYVLMPFTNFSIGNLAYMYEDLAASMLAGPKAYIVLLTTAFIASNLNLRYGWEYSGILIPALLALEWYQPIKLLVTFLETFFILIMASMLLKAPVFQRTTMEGARKLLFFFNISFFYKLAVGHIIINFFPQYHISDFYGFGYLLSTLLAIKMHDKEIAALITRASLQTSLASLFAATFIGFGLGFIPNIFSFSTITASTTQIASRTHSTQSLVDILREEQVLIYKTIRKNSVPPPLPEDIEIFQRSLLLLKKYVQNGNTENLQDATTLLERLNYRLYTIDSTNLVLREQEPKRGWGMYIINFKSDNTLQVQVPDPLGEWGTNYAGLNIFTTFGCQSLAIAGSRRKANDDGSADVITTTNTFFYTFQHVFGKDEVIQLRALTEKNIDRITSGERSITTENDDKISSLFMVNNSLPKGLNFSKIREELGYIEFLWQPSSYDNQLRDSSTGSFSEFFLTRNDRRTLLFKPLFSTNQPGMETSVRTIKGDLFNWFYGQKNYLAPKGSEQYIPPTLEELLFWDKEIITPLIQFLETARIAAQWSEQDRDELRFMQNSARSLGYNLIHYQQHITGEEYLILTETENDNPRKYWGTFIFRLGTPREFLVQVPRPLSELNVFEYSLSLFQNLNAVGLLISGSHSRANLDGSADVLKEENKANIFNLSNQVFLRESGNKHILVVQCRAFSNVSAKDTPNALIAAHSGIDLGKSKSYLLEELENVLIDRYRFSVKHFNGRENETGYEVSGIPQVLYLNQSKNKEFINLWLSPSTRSAFRQQSENRPLVSQFTSLKINSITKDLYSYLTTDKIPAANQADILDIQILHNQIEEYVHSYDILALQQILLTWPDLKFEQVIDTTSQQAFLVAMTENDQPLLVANLHPLQDEQVFSLTRDISRAEIQRYIDSRSLWLRITNSK